MLPPAPTPRQAERTPGQRSRVQRFRDAPTIGQVKRILLTPRWILLHLSFVAATIATGFLARWQWDRAHEAGGSFQNLGYALQWPLFGLFALFLWYRLARLELERVKPAETGSPGGAVPDDGVLDDTSAAGRATPASTSTVVAPPNPATDADADPRRQHPHWQRTSKRRTVPPPAPTVTADEDPELAAYNSYLAELNAADQGK